MKRVLTLFVVGGLAITSLTGCSSSSSSDTTVATETTAPVAADTTAAVVAADTTAAPAAETTAPVAADTTASAASAAPDAAGLAALKGKKVVYLINGALGDKGFYDSGEQGVKALESSGVTTRTLEANFDAAKYQALVDAAFEEGDIVFAIAYGFEDQLKAAAKAHPDTPVVNLDFDINDPDKNVTSVDFVEEESAYLAGVAAALTTTDTSIAGINPEKKLGVVLGDTDPVTTSFKFAFENGAKSIDPATVVEFKSLGGAWDDQAKGKQAAEQLYDGGSDVVFQVAAAAGLGVLQAAKERNLYAIGVDANQNDLQPGHVIASDIKNLGATIDKVAATIGAGTFERGVVLSYGIAQGGVDLDLTASTKVLPDATIAKIGELRQQIIDGSLKVARYKA